MLCTSQLSLPLCLPTCISPPVSPAISCWLCHLTSAYIFYVFPILISLLYLPSTTTSFLSRFPHSVFPSVFLFCFPVSLFPCVFPCVSLSYPNFGSLSFLCLPPRALPIHPPISLPMILQFCLSACISPVLSLSLCFVPSVSFPSSPLLFSFPLSLPCMSLLCLFLDLSPLSLLYLSPLFLPSVSPPLLLLLSLFRLSFLYISLLFLFSFSPPLFPHYV